MTCRWPAVFYLLSVHVHICKQHMQGQHQRARLHGCAQGIVSSLSALGVDALDLVQFYWHDYGVPNYVAAAQRLHELQEAGLIRHVGVTNFDVPRLAEIADAGVRIVSNQARGSLQFSGGVFG